MPVLRSFVWIVSGLFSAGVLAASCDGFVDVDSSNTTYCTAVSYVKDRGVTVGCTDDTHYCPNDYVTRLQMALFLQRMGRADPSNTLGDHTTTIGGGDLNTASAQYATVGGGKDNTASGANSTVAGGLGNTAGGISSFVAGGTQNTANGDDSLIAGNMNSAAGYASVVFGVNGVTTSDASGSFVFSDGTPNGGAPFGTTLPNRFLVSAANGIRFLTNKDGSTGCSIPAGGGAWSCSSSRDVKRDFTPVDTSDVLAKIAALPVMQWRYMNEPADVRHMGTFAQDFRAAFGLGEDDKTISTVDADGVALAAIQGLNAKLGQQLQERDAEIAALKARLDRIEAQTH